VATTKEEEEGGGGKETGKEESNTGEVRDVTQFRYKHNIYDVVCLFFPCDTQVLK
jgi:hypothetical protein